jgi:hypothetical protein
MFHEWDYYVAVVRKGMSYEDLKESIKKKVDRERRRLAEERRLQAKAAAASADLLLQDSSGSSITAGDSASRETKFSKPVNEQGRKDSSPIRVCLMSSQSLDSD